MPMVTQIHMKHIIWGTIFLLLFFSAACQEHFAIVDSEDKRILNKGNAGDWDHILRGAISPGALIKTEHGYLLYYIGADGNRSFDEGPRHRAVGVAQSPDLLQFTKDDRNPVLQFLPNQEEEGIFSLATMVDEDGTILLYYGAMTTLEDRRDEVNCDVRLAVSRDGRSFHDRGIVLAHDDKRVWGYGDELTPLGVIKQGDDYFLYYLVPNGKGVKWGFAIATLQHRVDLIETRPIINSGDWVIGGSVVPLYDGSDHIAFVLSRSSDWKNGHLEIYNAPKKSPHDLEKVCELDEFLHLTAFCEPLSDNCAMVYRHYLDPTGTFKINYFDKNLLLHCTGS